jgi:PAS domain S-box-containing protein
MSVSKKNKKLLEKEFQDYILFSSLHNTKIGLWVTIFLFTFSSIFNTLVFRDSEVNKYLMTFSALLPFIILTLLAIYIKSLHKWLTQIFILLTALSSLAIFFVGALSDINQPGYEYYFAWTMLMIMGTFIFYRIRFPYIVAINALIVISFTLALVINHTLRDKPDIFSFNVFFVIDIFFLGFFIAASRQSLTRKLFFRDKELSEKNIELEKEIIERRTAEISLQESEKNYKDSLEALPDWIHVVDINLRFVFMNTQFKIVNQSLGLETDVLGKHITEVFPFIPQDRTAEYKNIFATGKVFIVEEKVPVNGREFFTETRLIPIYKDNKVTQMITVIRDIGKKKEIEALKLKNAEQKEILLREIHHRVKNSLSIVISLLDMQIRNNPNPAFIIMARDVEFRIRSMALIHEHLYKSDELDRVSLNQYLNALATTITRTYNIVNIELVSNLEQVDVKIEIAMPLGLIVNEILTNACKYAFHNRQAGKIAIDLRGEGSDPDLYRLTIKDDGIGLPKGFSIESQSTLGMFIIKLLAEQIYAKLIIENHQGTSFSIVFKGIRSEK